MSQDTIKIKTIKSGSIIDIKVGDRFYQRIQQLFFWYSNKDQERAIKTIELLKTREPVDDFENHFLTLLSLIYEIEARAEEQGHLQDTEVNRTKKA